MVTLGYYKKEMKRRCEVMTVDKLLLIMKLLMLRAANRDLTKRYSPEPTIVPRRPLPYPKPCKIRHEGVETFIVVVQNFGSITEHYPCCHSTNRLEAATTKEGAANLRLDAAWIESLHPHQVHLKNFCYGCAVVLCIKASWQQFPLSWSQ